MQDMIAEERPPEPRVEYSLLMSIRNSTVLFLIPVAALLLAADSAEERDVALATAKLAEALELQQEDVEVQSAEAIEWPDTSLGCPRKGMSYLQMLVPGHRVTLRAAGSSYAVHVGDGRAIVCETTARDASTELAERKRVVESVVEARRHLAARLELAETEVRIVAVDRDPPGSGVEACVQPPEGEERAGSPRAVIELEAAGERFVYQLLGDEVVACTPAADPAGDEGG